MYHFCIDFFSRTNCIFILYYTIEFPQSSTALWGRAVDFGSQTCVQVQKVRFFHTVNKTHGGANSLTGQVGTHWNILCNSVVKDSPALTAGFPWWLRFPSLMSRYFARGYVSVPRTPLSAASVSMDDALWANQGPVNRQSPSSSGLDSSLGNMDRLSSRCSLPLRARGLWTFFQ